MLENLVRKYLLDHLSRNDMLSLCQHGFVHGRSCATNLLEVLDDWTRILDEGGTVDAIYLDFMKAFDSVPHQCLLRKLESYGIHGKIIMWLKGFLTGRRQCVVVGGKESTWEEVLSGVP